MHILELEHTNEPEDEPKAVPEDELEAAAHEESGKLILSTLKIPS